MIETLVKEEKGKNNVDSGDTCVSSVQKMVAASSSSVSQATSEQKVSVVNQSSSSSTSTAHMTMKEKRRAAVAGMATKTVFCFFITEKYVLAF